MDSLKLEQTWGFESMMGSKTLVLMWEFESWTRIPSDLPYWSGSVL